MTLWKLAAAYFIPTLILVSLLSGHFISQVGLLEKWFLGDNEIRQIVSPPPVMTPSRTGNPLKAVATLRQPAKNRSGRAEGNVFENGDRDRIQKRFANAYKDSLKTAFRTAKAYFNLALACNRTGRIDEAIQAYQQALVHQRDFPHALLNLGVLHYRRQEWQQAREAFEAASRWDSNYAKAHFNLSLAYGKLGELDKAAQAARRVLALNDRSVAAYNLLGLIHTLQGDYDAAIAVYKQGLAVNAKDAELLSNLSRAYQKMNQMNLTEEDLLLN